MTEPMDMAGLILEGQDRFFAMMVERHQMGEAKYGPIKFMDVNTLEEALEELVDLGNYAMYTFMKVWILNQQLIRVQGNQPTVLGTASFIPSGGK